MSILQSILRELFSFFVRLVLDLSPQEHMYPTGFPPRHASAGHPSSQSKEIKSAEKSPLKTCNDCLYLVINSIIMQLKNKIVNN